MTPLSAPAKRGRGTTLRSRVVEGAQDSTRRNSSAPAKRGRGTARRAVEGAQDSTRRKSLRDVQTFSLARFFLRRESSATTTKLRVRRPLHHGSLAARAPVVPLPRCRGGGWCERSHSRDAVRVRVCRPKPPIFRLQKNKGRRSAEKAQLSRGASPRIGCCHPLALRARPRVQRDALAFRRSTAALASTMCRGSIRAALHATLCAGVTCVLGVALKRSTSRAGRNAGGVDARTARERQ